MVNVRRVVELDDLLGRLNAIDSQIPSENPVPNASSLSNSNTTDDEFLELKRQFLIKVSSLKSVSILILMIELIVDSLVFFSSFKSPNLPPQLLELVIKSKLIRPFDPN